MEKIIKQIVLIGGGYATIWAYRSIKKELLIEMMTGQVQINIICPEEFHFFHGWTAESLSGIIRDQNRMSPLSDIFKHAKFIIGKANRIDPVSQIVFVEMPDGSQQSVPYDQLLLGMGSTDNTAVEGLAEHAYFLKSQRDFLRTKMRIQYLVQQAAEADERTARNILHFVIAGGGFTGVEIAANLVELINVLKNQYPTLRSIKPVVRLVNSRYSLLPGLHPGLQRMRHYAEKILRQYGIEILYQTKIIRATPRGAHLNDGTFIESRMIISTIGQSRIVLNGTENMERDPEKRIITNSFLQVKDQAGIWGAGDAVHVNHSKTMKANPSNALWAIKQGEHAGRNIARAILSQPLKPFTYQGLGQCASLGIGKGMGELYGIQFTGWMAWIMRWCFFQHFMPSNKVMWREIGDWIHLFITRKRRDLSMNNKEIRDSFQFEKVRPGDLNKLVYQN